MGPTHDAGVRGAAARRLLSILLCFGAAGCSFDSSGLGPPYWSCETELWDCPLVTVPPGLTVSGGPGYPQAQSYKQRPDLWADPKQAYQVYWDQSTFLHDVGFDELKGSLLVMTGAKDASLPAAKDFLRIKAANDVKGFYVAYDSRANPKPMWLRQEYVTETDSNHVPYQVTITLADKSKATQAFVKLDIWRRKSVPTKGQTVILPTNTHGGPAWPGVPSGNQAMYLVFVKPAERVDCAKGVKLSETAKFFECEQDPNTILDMALADCRDKQGAAYECRNSVCGQLLEYTQDGCPARTVWGSMLKMQPESFVPSSEIGFSAPKSTAVIEVEGQKFRRGISGNLHFEYQLGAYQALTLMRVNALKLTFDPFDSELGRIENVAIAALLPALAECTDQYPPWRYPCQGYRIRKGDLRCAEICTVDGNRVAFASENDRDLDIQVDSKARTMTLTGSTSGTARIDDEDVSLKIQLTLVGDFLNFAPTAAPSVETTREVECSGERTNRDPVVLDASSSFDIYETLPATNPAYEWREDHRLVTEKPWGQGKTVTIAPHKLGLGVHAMTLLVLDKNGVADTDRFDVAVRDRVPPELVAPGDVHLLRPSGTGSVKVDLGKASVSDACSPEVSVRNDAPAGSLFSPGVTTVTWEAEDGSGNVTKQTQNVYYFTYKKRGFRDGLAEAAPFLEKSAAESAGKLEECQAACPCEIGLRPLTGTIEQLVEQARRLPPAERERGAGQLERLEAAAAALQEADSLLEQSNASGRQKQSLRRAAVQRLQSARDLLRAAAERSEEEDSE